MSASLAISAGKDALRRTAEPKAGEAHRARRALPTAAADCASSLAFESRRRNGLSRTEPVVTSGGGMLCVRSLTPSSLLLLLPASSEYGGSNGGDGAVGGSVGGDGGGSGGAGSDDGGEGVFCPEPSIGSSVTDAGGVPDDGGDGVPLSAFFW